MRDEPTPLRLGFFASHGGTNMQAIIDACKDGRLAATPCVVISNNSASEALKRARRESIPACHLSRRTHPSPGELDRRTAAVLGRHRVNLVVLAGYMRKLGAPVLSRYPRRVLNVHPALLPRFGGAGMYGRAVHEAVLAAGETETGATVHVVDEEYDSRARTGAVQGARPARRRRRTAQNSGLGAGAPALRRDAAENRDGRDRPGQPASLAGGARRLSRPSAPACRRSPGPPNTAASVM